MVVWLFFSSIVQIWYANVRISRSISESTVYKMFQGKQTALVTICAFFCTTSEWGLLWKMTCFFFSFYRRFHEVTPEIVSILLIQQSSKLTSALSDAVCSALVLWIQHGNRKATYRIRPNYRTCPYMRTVKQFRSLLVTANVFVSTFFYKSICCRYSFELPRQVEAIQMSTHSICFYKDNQKQILRKHH